MGPPPPAAALEGGGLRSSAIPPQSVRSAAHSTSSVSSGHSHISRDSQVGAGASNLMQMAQGGQNLPTIPLKSGPGSASSHALSNPSDWANSPASSAAQCRASQCGSVCNGGSAAHDACSGTQRLADGAQRSSQRGSAAAAAAEGRPHQAQASSDDPRRRPVQGRSPGSPSKGSTSHLRTVSAALQRLNGLPPDLPVDFPSGPFASIQMHMDQIKAWCTNPLTSGGIFQIREKEFKDAGKKRGAIARLVCNHEGKPRRQSSASAGVMHASADGDDGDDDVDNGEQDEEVDDLLDVEEGHVVGTTMGTRKRKKKPETESRKRGSWRCGCKWSVNLEVCRGLDGLEQ